LDQGPPGNSVGAVIDHNGRIHEISIRVLVSDANFRDLAGSAADRVLMAFNASRSVEYWAEPQGGVFPPSNIC
jgi:hypothetical protein